MKRLITGKKWIVAGCAVLLVVVVIVLTTMNAGIVVESAAVDRGEVTKRLKESGTAESASSIIITAKNLGEIKKILVQEGGRVKVGDALMIRDGAGAELDIKSLQAELSGLQVQYKQVRELANKNKALYEQGALSYEAYNSSNTGAKQLASQIASLQYSIESYAQSSGAGGVTAPVAGVITGVFVKEGEAITVGMPLFEISNLDDIYVKAEFIAEDADLIREGDLVMIYNEDANFLDENGVVKKVHLKAEDKISDLGVNQKRVTVEISFGTKEPVRLGSNLDVAITVEKRENALRISDLAVFERERKNCVYVIEGGKAVLREIKTGLEGEDFMEVISGLSEGEAVILSPNDDISEGVKVKIQ